MDQEELLRVAVELIIVDDSRQNIVMVQRGEEPAKGAWTLPAGHVKRGERLTEAAKREAREETGLKIHIEDFVDYMDDPDRDPRGPVISHAFLATVSDDMQPVPGDEAQDVKWQPVSTAERLPLRQDELVERALEVMQQWP